MPMLNSPEPEVLTFNALLTVLGSVQAVDLRPDAARSVVPAAPANRQRVVHRVAARRGDGVAQLTAMCRVQRTGRGGAAEKGEELQCSRFVTRGKMRIGYAVED